MTTQELRDQIYGVLESRDVMGGDSKVVLVDRIEELIIDRSRQDQRELLDRVASGVSLEQMGGGMITANDLSDVIDAELFRLEGQGKQ